MIKKKMAVLLAVSILVGSSLNVFANGIDIADNMQPIIHRQRKIILELDKTVALIDGQEYQLETVPKVIEGRTYLPLRFMADKLLKAEVFWNGEEKKVAVTQDSTKVEMKIGSNKAYVNGDQIEIENFPIIDENATYLPLRTMAELFEIQIDYHQETRTITLVKEEGDRPVIPDIKKPTAQFSFDQESYTAGQTVRAIDESFHEDDMAITNKLWMVNFNEKQTNARLENMFSKPTAGTYSISLKVQDSKGIWSEWVTRQITIKANQKPVITTFHTEKESYAGGEAIDFTHTYDNEPWENIKAERWTYRQESEPVNKVVVDKPKHIFHEGRYIVTLQLQDDYGNWSDVKETVVIINQESKQSELQYKFANGEAGEAIDNFSNFNYQSYKAITPDEIDFGGGILFMSNSPETVKQNGILYRDIVEGKGRILFHHTNNFTEQENEIESKRIVLVAENITNEPVSLSISNQVLKGPSNDILFVGQQLLYDYLKGSGSNQYDINPGEKIYIYDSGNRKWDKGQLLSGKMNFNASGQVKLTIACLGKNANMNDIEELPNLQRDAHPRGTFYKMDIAYKVELVDTEPTKLVLGAGDHEWVSGYDAMTAKLVQNRGNYGVNYKIDITAKEDMGVMLNPRGGLFRGALRWDDQDPFLAPNKGYIIGHNSKAIMLGVIKAGETRTLYYSLPNGSSTPVLLLFMPKDSW